MNRARAPQPPAQGRLVEIEWWLEAWLNRQSPVVRMAVTLAILAAAFGSVWALAVTFISTAGVAQ